LTGFLPALLPLHILPFFSRDYSLIGSLWIPPILYEQRSLPVHAKYLSSLLPPFVSAFALPFATRHFAQLRRDKVYISRVTSYIQKRRKQNIS